MQPVTAQLLAPPRSLARRHAGTRWLLFLQAGGQRGADEAGLCRRWCRRRRCRRGSTRAPPRRPLLCAPATARRAAAAAVPEASSESLRTRLPPPRPPRQTSTRRSSTRECSRCRHAVSLGGRAGASRRRRGARRQQRTPPHLPALPWKTNSHPPRRGTSVRTTRGRARCTWGDVRWQLRRTHSAPLPLPPPSPCPPAFTPLALPCLPPFCRPRQQPKHRPPTLAHSSRAPCRFAHVSAQCPVNTRIPSPQGYPTCAIAAAPPQSVLGSTPPGPH